MRSDTKRYDAIVLGAGAAGLMSAHVAGQRGRKILLVDHAQEPGKKILISGGGRCNFTNLYTEPHCFLSHNPHFARSALARYQPQDFIDLVNRYGIAFHEKALGQLFCDGRARQIVDMLVRECNAGGVELVVAQSVRALEHRDGKYCVTFDNMKATAPKLVLATGGPSIPKMGATGFAYDIARQFGLSVITPRPALVPFTLGQNAEAFKALAGVATPCVAAIGKVAFREAFLFTHRGLSGPAILQISSYWLPGQSITLDLTPDSTKGWLGAAKHERPRSSLASVLSGVLPGRLASVLGNILARDYGCNGPVGAIGDRVLGQMEDRLRTWTFTPSGTEGFAKAEVTVGGVDTHELSQKTMASKVVPGLYVIGEAVDVTGWLGGYNFQWAWASGHVAGLDL